MVLNQGDLPVESWGMAPPESPSPDGRFARDDVAALRLALAAAERRAAALAELTALVSGGRHPLELAQRAVELTARTTRADGAFVYLWDRDDEQLVLRVATEGVQRGHVGQIRLRLGEGVTGWTALMRQTVVIPSAPENDPRFKPYPQLRESAFKSMVAVPIVAPGEEVLGVFTLYARGEDAFVDSDVSLATEVGRLLASGLVQAETLDRLQVQSAAAQFLHDLPQDTWGTLERCLTNMANECAVAMEADVCIVEVMTDDAQPHQAHSSVTVAEGFREEHFAGARQAQIGQDDVLGLVDRLSLHRLRIPLGAAAPSGAITCFRARRFTQDDERLLEGIGSQIAAGVLALRGSERVRPVVDELIFASAPEETERLLRQRGWRADRTCPVVVRIRPSRSGAWEHDDEEVYSLLKDAFAGRGRNALILGSNGRYLALCEITEVNTRASLLERVINALRQARVRIYAGVGPETAVLREVHAGLSHAQNALAWSQLSGTGIVGYEEVAHLHLLPRKALAGSAEMRELLDLLADVVKYDLDNGTELIETLDVFLSKRGSVAQASSALFIHRNTLRQRLQRIEELIGLSPEEFDDWVSVGLAARLMNQSETDLRELAGHGQRHGCPRGVVISGRHCCGLASACVFAGPTPQHHA